MKKVLGLSNYSIAETDRCRCDKRTARLHDDKKLLKWLKCKEFKESKLYY